MNDEVKSRTFADGAEIIDDVFRLFHAEAQPLVRRHDEQAGSPGGARHLRVLDSIGNTLAAQPGHNGELSLDLVSHDACDLGALLGGEREDSPV